MDRLRAEPFDLVITDLGTPGMSGWEAGKAAREIAPRTPVILVTGWGVDPDTERVRASGIDQALAKPFQRISVLNAVAEAIFIRQEGAGPPPLGQP